MKITKRQLRRIIKEEKARLLKEQPRASAMGQTAKSDALFDARDNLLGLIETLDPAEYHAYIDTLIRELEMMKQDI